MEEKGSKKKKKAIELRVLIKSNGLEILLQYDDNCIRNTGKANWKEMKSVSKVHCKISSSTCMLWNL